MSEGRDPETGRFLPGNKIWEMAPPVSHPPTFAEPEDLWAAATGYFDWCHENPLYADNLVAFQGKATHEPLAKQRAMTIRGLCLFLGISHETWRQWKITGGEIYRAKMIDTINRIEDVIFTTKFEGAAAGLLDQSIIARELGLADKRELAGPGGGPIRTINESMTPQEAAEAYAATLHGNAG